VKTLDHMCPAIRKDSSLCVVAENLETFLARQGQRDRVVPRFVELELRAFLDCGVLCRGFFEGSLRCLQTGPACPIFLQKRGFCPSCGGGACPTPPLIWWIAFSLKCRFGNGCFRSLFFALSPCLRFFLVRDVLQIFVRTIFASIRRRAGIPASNRQARCGAVAFIQRFSDALNLDPHFHVLALDGLYVIDGKSEPVFQHGSPPMDTEVAQVAERVHRRVARLMENRGWGRKRIPMRPMVFDATNRYSPNYTGPLFRVVWRRGRAPACALREREMKWIPKTARFQRVAAVRPLRLQRPCWRPRSRPDRLRLERLARYGGRQAAVSAQAPLARRNHTRDL